MVIPEQIPTESGWGARTRAEIRVAIVISHPIQHFVAFFRALAAQPGVVLRVFYCARIGLESYFDREMEAHIAWRADLVGGYDHCFLPGAEGITRVGRTFSVDNPGVAAALKGFSPDVALLYGYNHLTNLRALAWCRLAGAPALLIGDSELLRDRSWWRSAVKKVALPHLLRLFRCFLTTGDNNEAYYRHYGVGDERMFRAPLTIDEESFRSARAERARLRESFRVAHCFSPDELIVLFVGKLSDYKRPDDLIHAARRAFAQGVRLRVLYAGAGAMAGALRELAAREGVAATFLGFVNVDRLPAVYAAADVLAHPSQMEGRGLVCPEAACVGLPLVVSDRVGAVGRADVARPGENAHVFPCGDIAVLTQALIALATDAASRERMGVASQRIFDELDMRRSVAGALAAFDYCLSMGETRRISTRPTP